MVGDGLSPSSVEQLDRPAERPLDFPWRARGESVHGSMVRNAAEIRAGGPHSAGMRPGDAKTDTLVRREAKDGR